MIPESAADRLLRQVLPQDRTEAEMITDAGEPREATQESPGKTGDT